MDEKRNTQTHIATKVSVKTKLLLGFMIIGCFMGMFAILGTLSTKTILKKENESMGQKIKIQTENNSYKLSDGDIVKVDDTNIGQYNNGKFLINEANYEIISQGGDYIDIEFRDLPGGGSGGGRYYCKCRNDGTRSCGIFHDSVLGYAYCQEATCRTGCDMFYLPGKGTSVTTPNEN